MAKKINAHPAEGLLNIDDEELELIRSALVYTLIDNTALDIETIYAYIYCNGKRILWN